MTINVLPDHVMRTVFFSLAAAIVVSVGMLLLTALHDVRRICLFDTWLSSIAVGRLVATVAEICFAVQWAIVLYQLSMMTGANTTSMT